MTDTPCSCPFDTGTLTADYLPLRCGVDHGWECCGCLDHPVGKPWGWNSSAWDEHWNQTTESEADE